MKPIEKILIQTQKTGYKIDDYSVIGLNNFNKQKQANEVASFFEKITELSTEFEPVSSFIKDAESDNPDEREITYLYKQWDIEIYIKNDVEDYLDYILSMIRCEIIFKEPVINTLSFYNSNDDLNTNIFYEVRDDLLLLHVSFCIKKEYGGAELIVPEAKLRISLKNSTVLNN